MKEGGREREKKCYFRLLLIKDLTFCATFFLFIIHTNWECKTHWMILKHFFPFIILLVLLLLFVIVTSDVLLPLESADDDKIRLFWKLHSMQLYIPFIQSASQSVN